MGYKLRREVRDAIPPGLLTAGERLLVLELADICNDDTREGWPGIAGLAQLTDMSDRSIQQTLNRVGKKWIELRVPLGKNADGKVFYAYTGKRTVYRFPPLPHWEGATDEWASGATDERPVEPTGATDESDWCDRSVGLVRQMSDPSPQGTTQKSTSQPPPTPSTPSTALVVVDAEVLEEEDGSTSSLETQTEKLIDDIVGLKPNWRRKRPDIREQINSLYRSFDENFPAVVEIALGTARAPDSAHPSRMTAAGNPVLVAANQARLIVNLDAYDTGPSKPAHPQAHSFEGDPSAPSCLRCSLPKTNERHWVGNQGGYVAQRRSNYIRMTDSHHPSRDYSESF